MVDRDRRVQLNADRRRRFGEPGRTLALVCECGDPDCRLTVLLTVERYDLIRPGEIVHPEHRVPLGQGAGPPTANPVGDGGGPRSDRPQAPP